METKDELQAPKIGGYIGYLGLGAWWQETFDEEERKYIIERFRKYHPVSGPDSLLNDPVYPSKNLTPSSYLNFLVCMLRKPNENSIARKIAKKSTEMASRLSDMNFALLWTIRLNYKARKISPEAMEIALSACRDHIAIAQQLADHHKESNPNLPLGYHEGYSQLVKVLEKQRDYVEVIRLSQEAEEMGWQGNWDVRIQRCVKKLGKIITDEVA